MAHVTIDIPGVGKVVAENAASEDTLNRILTAIQRQSSQNTSNRSANNSSAANTSSAASTRAANNAAANNLTATNQSTGAMRNMGNQFKQTGRDVLGFGKDLAITGKNIVEQFATAADSMSKDPIGAAAGFLNTGMDLAGSAAKLAAQGIGGLAAAAVGAIPFVGGGLAAATNMTTEAAKMAVDTAVSLGKMANDVFASEFKKLANELHDMTRSGMAFSGGLLEFKEAATAARLDTETFGKILKTSTEDLHQFGLSQGEAALALSKGIKATVDVTGKSGRNLRDEMMALGYSYEEQGEVMAQYMAQQKQAGANLANIAPESLAKGAREYAANLKIISDITGQDAKKLMQKARMESMRASVAKSLNTEQKKAFQTAYSEAAAFGPDFQEALLQSVASGGVITNPTIAVSEDAVDAIHTITNGITNASEDMAKLTGDAMAKARKNIESGDFASVISLATVMGGQVTKSIDNFFNTVLQSGVTQEMVAAAKKQNEDMAKATDPIIEGYVAVSKAANEAAMTMANLVQSNLPKYADILKTTMEMTVEGFKNFVEFLSDGGFLSKEAFIKLGKKIAGAAGVGGSPESDIDRQDAINHERLSGLENLSSSWGKMVEMIEGKEAAAKHRAARVAEETAATKNRTAQDENGTWYDPSLVAKKALGGYTEPGKINVAGEEGMEAVVPLPDGKTIPVMMDNSALVSKIEELTKFNFSGTVDKLQAALSGVSKEPVVMQPQQQDLSSVSASVINDTKSMLAELQTNIVSALSNQQKEQPATPQIDYNKTADERNAMLIQSLESLITAARDQLEKQDEMLRAMNDTKDATERLYNAMA